MITTDDHNGSQSQTTTAGRSGLNSTYSTEKTRKKSCHRDLSHDDPDFYPNLFIPSHSSNLSNIQTSVCTNIQADKPRWTTAFEEHTPSTKKSNTICNNIRTIDILVNKDYEQSIETAPRNIRLENSTVSISNTSTQATMVDQGSIGVDTVRPLKLPVLAKITSYNK